MGNSLLPAAPIPAATSTANTYTDLNGLAALKKDSRSPQALHAIAQQVDALFLQMMLKSMRDASAATGEANSNEMGMYQDMFDKQISLTLSQHQDLGLGSLLTRQIPAAAAAPASAMANATSSAPANATAGSPASATTTSPTSAPASSPTSAPASSPTNATTSAPASGTAGTAGSNSAAAAPAAVAAPSTTMLQNATQFVGEVLPTITRAAQALGVSPLGLLAQAALETGWGKRMARTADGAPSLNMFGIKADDTWQGARASANTVEFSGGVASQRHTAFRAYGSIEDSVSDFANLLKGSPRYARAIAAGGNAQAYVNGIGQSGYATDPEYANKLNEILNGSTLRLALNVSGSGSGNGSGKML
jgi:flagellar protein FlgJ